MAASGTIEIGGVTYRWTSPTIGDIMAFEQETGMLLVDPQTCNSARGRAYLAEICLKPNHPDITAGQILKWPAEHLLPLWEMLREAIPIFTSSPERSRPPAKTGEDEAGADPSAEASAEAGTGPTPTSSPAPSSSDGAPARPEESE